MSREVPGRALGRLHPDLPRPVQLWSIRVQRPFSPPIVEDARRLPKAPEGSFLSFTGTSEGPGDGQMPGVKVLPINLD
jgi:hypothetical protein